MSAVTHPMRVCGCTMTFITKDDASQQRQGDRTKCIQAAYLSCTVMLLSHSKYDALPHCTIIWISDEATWVQQTMLLGHGQTKSHNTSTKNSYTEITKCVEAPSCWNNHWTQATKCSCNTIRQAIWSQGSQ